MSKRLESSFFLPIHLSGIGDAAVKKAALQIALRAWLVTGVLVAAAWAFGLSRPGIRELLTDAAFFLVRRPVAIQRSLASLHGAPWGPWLELGALMLLAWAAASPVIQITSTMARTLSIGDEFPLSTDRTRRMGTRLACGFILSICLGGVLWLVLLQETDAVALRVIRLVSLGLFVQLCCLLLGGALASMHAEGRGGLEALRRMISLASSQPGHFLRSIVYTLPRWMGTAAYHWLQTALSLVLPFVAAVALLGPYASLLGPEASGFARTATRIVSVVAGLVLVPFCFYLMRRSGGRGERIVGCCILLTAAWGLFLFPFVRAEIRNISDSWFMGASALIVGREAPDLSRMAMAGLALVGLVCFQQICFSLGLLVVAYPLAAGVCSFFLLRRAAEGKAFRATGGSSQVAPQSRLVSLGGNVFRAGGEMAFSQLSPPRGWPAVAWIGLKISTLALGLAAGVCLAAAVFGNDIHSANYGLPFGVVLIVILAVVLPLLCRWIGQPLRGSLSQSALSAYLFPVGVVATWGRVAFEVAFLCALMALGGTVGLIPGAGPLAFGALFILVLMPSSGAVGRVLLWIPGNLILYPVLACEMGKRARAWDVLRQTDYYCSVAPWTFLAACAAGLPFGLLPPALAGLALHFLQPALPTDPAWTICARGCVAGLAIVGLASTLTNAYLTLRGVAGERPLQIGDAVILGRHTPVNGEDNWSPLMDRYVGKKARILAFVGQDGSGCDIVRVSADGSQFVWRVENLTRV